MNKLIFLFTIFLFILTPFESLPFLGFANVSIVKIISILLIFAGILKFNLHLNSIIILYFLFILYNFLSLLFSIDIENSSSHIFFFLIPNLLLLLIVCSNFNSSKSHYLILSFSISSFILSIIVIYFYFNFFIFKEAEFSRVFLFEKDPNELSYFIVTSISYLLIHNQIINNKSIKFLFYFFILIMIFATLLTGSRTAFLSFFILIIFFLFNNFKTSMILKLALILIPSIISINYYFSDTYLYDRFTNIGDEISNKSLGSRAYIWEFALNKFINSENILIGVGPKNFFQFISTNSSLFKHGHNTFIINFIELGIIGSFLYFIILLWAFVKSIKLVKFYSIYVCLPIVIYCFYSLSLGLESRRWLILILIFLHFYEKKAKDFLIVR